MSTIIRLSILVVIGAVMSACSTLPRGEYSSYYYGGYSDNPYYGPASRYDSDGVYDIAPSPFGYPYSYGAGYYNYPYSVGLASPYYGYYGYPGAAVITRSRRHGHHRHHHSHMSRPMPAPTAAPRSMSPSPRSHRGVSAPIPAGVSAPPNHGRGHVPYNRRTRPP